MYCENEKKSSVLGILKFLFIIIFFTNKPVNSDCQRDHGRHFSQHVPDGRILGAADVLQAQRPPVFHQYGTCDLKLKN
jgi:hypothetical protein